MKVFHCDHCGQLVFFENINCVNCGRVLAYVPDLGTVTSLDPINDGQWTSPLAQGQRYRLCENYRVRKVCNWAMPAEDSNALCHSCRLTRTIPDVSLAENVVALYRFEMAKRRLIYTLDHLGLKVQSKVESPATGLAFDFLADSNVPGVAKVMTGHDEGLITLALAEADDAERERRRMQLHEPYRTVLGHFRHEVGHYFWDRLIRDTPLIDDFRNLFGDDREDYGQALQRHYIEGAPKDWQDRFVSEYATTHAWEDWAETWAHYLHIADTLETAAECGIALRPKRKGEPALRDAPNPVLDHNVSFDRMMDSWVPLTYVLNNLNRGLGMGDAYPFVLSPPAVEKLRFVHRAICQVFNSQDVPQNVQVGGECK